MKRRVAMTALALLRLSQWRHFILGWRRHRIIATTIQITRFISRGHLGEPNNRKAQKGPASDADYRDRF